MTQEMPNNGLLTYCSPARTRARKRRGRAITTCYQNDKPDLFSQHKSDKGIYFEYSGEQKGNRLPDPAKITPRELKLDGDFRSEECVNLLKQADIVVTNPPFSLFREYVEQLVRYRKNPAL